MQICDVKENNVGSIASLSALSSSSGVALQPPVDTEAVSVKAQQLHEIVSFYFPLNLSLNLRLLSAGGRGGGNSNSLFELRAV